MAQRAGSRAPRTLPLLLELLKSKKLNAKRLDPSSTYMVLWTRHLDSGVVEVTSELELAYEAGFANNRALRSWQERMRLLEDWGFIKTQQIGNERYRYVLMIDPAVAVDALEKKGLIESGWRATYDARRIATKEGLPPAAEKTGGDKILVMPRAVKK